jgi:hypothetical protein
MRYLHKKDIVIHLASDLNTLITVRQTIIEELAAAAIRIVLICTVS